MPTAPTLREQVVAGSLPGVRQSAAGATPQAFGAGVGQALSGAGGQMVDLANSFQEEENVLKAKRAYFGAMTELGEYENQLQSLSGDAAIAFGQEAISGLGRHQSVFDKIRDSAVRELTENQKQKFDQHWIPQQLAAIQSTGRYLTKQRQALHDSIDRGLMAQGRDRYLRTGDSEGLAASVAALTSRLRRAGVSPEEISTKVSDWIGQAHMAKIELIMATGDGPDAADEYFEEHQEAIPSGLHAAAERAIKHGRKVVKQDKKVEQQRIVAEAYGEASGNVESYVNAVVTGDVEGIKKFRSEAQIAIHFYEEAGRDANDPRTRQNAQLLRRVILSSEAKARTEKTAEELDWVKAQAESIRIEMNGGLIDSQQAYQQAMELWPNADGETRLKLDRTVRFAKLKEKEDAERAAKVTDFDHSNAVREMNGAMLTAFLEASGEDSAAEMSSENRLLLGAMQDDLDKYAATHTINEVGEYFRKMIRPLSDKKALNAAYSQYVARPLDVLSDMDFVLSPKAERMVQATADALRELEAEAVDEVEKVIEDADVPTESPSILRSTTRGLNAL